MWNSHHLSAEYVPEFSARNQQLVLPGLLTPHLTSRIIHTAICTDTIITEIWHRRPALTQAPPFSLPPFLSHTTHFHSNRITPWIQFLSHTQTSELKGTVPFLPISNTIMHEGVRMQKYCLSWIQLNIKYIMLMVVSLVIFSFFFFNLTHYVIGSCGQVWKCTSVKDNLKVDNVQFFFCFFFVCSLHQCFRMASKILRYRT